MGKTNLQDFAFLPDYSSQIDSLAALARPERWGYLNDQEPCKYPILRNYINHTFKRLQDLEDKSEAGVYFVTSADGKKLCFNTGLFTRNFESIYALFVPNKPGYKAKWQLRGFYKDSAHELRDLAPLPRRATYFTDTADLIYDTSLELRVNIDHILEDENNKKRIPEKYRDLPYLPMLFKGAALEYAKVRILENYKAAVPQYFNGRIQFLIPVSLGDPSVVDLSLAVGRTEDVYTGHTCLTLDMAYNNARLIAKPESDWLVNP